MLVDAATLREIFYSQELGTTLVEMRDHIRPDAPSGDLMNYWRFATLQIFQMLPAVQEDLYHIKCHYKNRLIVVNL